VPEQQLVLGAYSLGFVPGIRLRDFGGNHVWRMGASVSTFKEVKVVPERLREAQDSLNLDFVDDGLFFPLLIPGADGTARWGASGRVELGYPAAAGTGAEGPVELRDATGIRDLHASHLLLPEGATCALPSENGLVILRSQSTMRITGELTRKLSVPASSDAQDLHHDSLPRTTLTNWLNSRAESAEEWTVLVAGGDLIIDGTLVVDTPLLLVAGGRVRVTGRVRARGRALWLLGSGGILKLDPTTSTPNFEMDPPIQNPLVQPLVYAAVSSRVPKFSAALRWYTPVVIGHAGEGQFRVGYLPPEGPVDFENAVDHPRLLEGAGPMRVLIVLEMPVRVIGQKGWDPPWVDAVHLSWDRLTPPGER
ncbi:MAG: hypothetical protein ACI841_004875, partial [Planctomycetota bacterium]